MQRVKPPSGTNAANLPNAMLHATKKIRNDFLARFRRMRSRVGDILDRTQDSTHIIVIRQTLIFR
jgi:hypothetical protein